MHVHNFVLIRAIHKLDSLLLMAENFTENDEENFHYNKIYEKSHQIIPKLFEFVEHMLLTSIDCGTTNLKKRQSNEFFSKQFFGILRLKYVSC